MRPIRWTYSDKTGAREGRFDVKLFMKRIIPGPLLNNTLLTFPRLYRSRLVRYETNFQWDENVRELLDLLEKTVSLEGEIVECGSARCGTSIIMANFLKAKGIGKKIYACDSWEGFDREELAREREAGLLFDVPDKPHTSASHDYVTKKIRKLHLDDVIITVKGFFSDTLPNLSSTFSFVLIDCDLRESVSYCAENLWPKVVPGGLVVFDDYTSPNYRGTKLAVDAFIAERRADIADHRLVQRLYYARKS